MEHSERSWHAPAMSRYFFHLQNQTSYVRDEIGSDLPSLGLVRSRAAEAAGEILTSDLRDGRTQVVFDLQVDDETGDRLFTVHVASSVNPGAGGH